MSTKYNKADITEVETEDMENIEKLIKEVRDLTGRVTTQEGNIAELRRLVDDLRGNLDKYPTLTREAYHEAGHFILWVLNVTKNYTEATPKSITINDEGGGLFSPEYMDLREPEFYQKIITGRYDPNTFEPKPLREGEEDADPKDMEYHKEDVRRDIKMRMAGLGAEVIYQSRDTDIGDAFLSRYLINNRTQPDIKNAIEYNTAIGNQTPQDGTRPLVVYLREAINELRPLWGKVVKVARLLDEHRELKGKVLGKLEEEIYNYIEVRNMKRVYSTATNRWERTGDQNIKGSSTIINPITPEPIEEIRKKFGEEAPEFYFDSYKEKLRDWSNPYRAEEYGKEESLRLYRVWLDKTLKRKPNYLRPLIGQYLACSCKLDEPCHGDIIIEKLREKYN